ncbi:MAG TPA: hypothetical protein VM677_31060, partial [Actinokineospora sp.]|nr:hypothetical protein [Actinokineospora sp.]
LKIGQWKTADLVFPPVAGADTKAVELIGAGPPVRVELPAGRATGPLAWPAGGAWSGPRPLLEISPRAERTAEPTGDTPVELPTGAVGVSARFAAPFAEHRYKVPVEPKSKLRVEVFAERHRFPVDAALVVRDDKGTLLARAEDGPGTLDPVIEYAVPEKVTSVIVGVVETQGRAGPRAAYRLAVDPGGGAVKDFRLFTPAQRLSLPAGGRGVLPVFADRRGFVGPITLTPTGLPAGWTATRTTIPPDADGTLVTLTRTDAAADATVTTWAGNGRPLTVKGHPLERFQPWLSAEVAAAPVAGKAGVAIDWNALPDAAALAPPFKLKLPVKVTRPLPAAPVRLTLLTSQNPPLQNNQPDAAKTIRAEKAVELAAKASDGELVTLVPPELPADGYDIAVQAEVLSADKQRVLATAVTTVRRLPVRLPVAVKLDGGATVTATLAAKAATVVELKGEVTRTGDFKGDAVVALAGLPPGATAPPATVKAGETRFALKLTLPPTTPPGDVIEVSYDVNGKTFIKKLNATAKLGPGSFEAKVDLTAGTFVGDLALPGTKVNFSMFGFLPATASFRIVPDAQVAGTLAANGAVKAKAKVSIVLTDIRVFGLPIAGSSKCKSSTAIDLVSAPGFNPIAGGKLNGTYDIPPFANCGLFTPVINSLTAGPGNTLEIALTRK